MKRSGVSKSSSKTAMPSSTPQGIISPNINDVKPGGGNHSHQGNKYYIQLVDQNKKRYVLSDARNKDNVATEIYRQISQLHPPGRFLEKTSDGTYRVKDRSSSIRKIKKALSENSAAIIENLKRRGQYVEPGSGGGKPKSTSKGIPKL